MDILSKAMYHARELAMSRMRAEATAMGADGIVGIKLTIKRLEWDQRLLEFVAIGTGVAHCGGRKGFRAHDGGQNLTKSGTYAASQIGGCAIDLFGLYEPCQVSQQLLPTEVTGLQRNDIRQALLHDVELGADRYFP